MMSAPSLRNPKTLKNSDEEGLSLVEVVVAMVVFSIIALAAYPLFYKSIEIVSTHNMITTATTSANDYFEKIRKTPTCENIEGLSDAVSGTQTDARGKEYVVEAMIYERGWVYSYDENGEHILDEYGNYARHEAILPYGDGCWEGRIFPVIYKVTRESDGKELFSQRISVLVPPANGVFDVRESN